MMTNTIALHESSSSLLAQPQGALGRYDDLPMPLADEDGGGDCYPNDENETGP